MSPVRTHPRAKVVEDASRLLSTSTAIKASRWDELLRLQVDLFLPQEVDFYFSSDAWRQARSVLDAGCGNGYYLSRLQTFFPAKAYSGIDISPELVEMAKRRQPEGVTFAQGDFFALDNEAAHDVILMRFIVQHLKDFNSLLAQASRILRPGGSLIIIEPDLKNSANFPSIPYFDEMLAKYHQSAAQEERIRGRLDDLPAQAAATDGWRVAGDQSIASPRIGPFAGTNLQRTYMRWIDLCEQSRMFSFAFDKARHAVEEWGERSAAFSRISLRILSLKLCRIS